MQSQKFYAVVEYTHEAENGILVRRKFHSREDADDFMDELSETFIHGIFDVIPL
jgi:hypothetical protein